MPENGQDTRSGYAAVIGLPNAGKSTLVNKLVGTKVSIVSRKVQTTRNRVLGITMQDEAQIILIDTPGIFMPRKTLEKAMVRTAWDAVPEADSVIHLVDASARDPLRDSAIIIRGLRNDAPCFLALNKTDKVSKPDLLTISAAFNERFPYTATYMISGLKGGGVKDLLRGVANSLPKGPWLFPEDQVTDMPMRLMAAEITREKIFERLHEELPYSIMVSTENWEEFDNGSVKIDQAIYTQRDSQKAIVLGKGGAQIQEIGKKARLELEEILERRVHLKLFVKVKEDWPERWGIQGDPDIYF
ncbi:MAG: GTPase Era [Alphaproteobacteria bacterium]|nr:GTPase Era [Alphaproteobacteria bacterium]